MGCGTGTGYIDPEWKDLDRESAIRFLKVSNTKLEGCIERNFELVDNVIKNRDYKSAMDLLDIAYSIIERHYAFVESMKEGGLDKRDKKFYADSSRFAKDLVERVKEREDLIESVEFENLLDNLENGFSKHPAVRLAEYLGRPVDTELNCEIASMENQITLDEFYNELTPVFEQMFIKLKKGEC